MKLNVTVFGTALVILSAIGPCFTLPAAGATNLGRKVELANKPDGKPHFGVQYMSGRDAFVAITFAVKGNQLIASPMGTVTPSFWAIADKSTGNIATTWQPTLLNGSSFTAAATVAMTLSVPSVSASAVAKNLKQAVIVLSLNTAGSPSSNAYIDVAELCANNPGQFVDLNSGSSGCP
jgi:hypothetical protein